MSPRLPSSPSAPATDADDRTSGRDRPPNRARPSPSRDDANTAYAPDGTAPDGTVDLEYPFGAPPAPPTVAAGVVLVPGRPTGPMAFGNPPDQLFAPALSTDGAYTLVAVN
jgi:hypothetical protein